MYQHVQVMSESENDGESGVINDAFFCEEAQVVSPNGLPKQAKITKGCAINVSVRYKVNTNTPA